MKRLCWLQAQKFGCTDPPTWWSKPCSARMWAWCPSCLNPNRRTTNKLKTQGRDVSSGKCSPAKFLKAGPACMQEWPGSGSRDVFNSKLVWHKSRSRWRSSLVAVPAVPGMEFEQAVPRDLCSTKAFAGTDSSSIALHNVADKKAKALWSQLVIVWCSCCVQTTRWTPRARWPKHNNPIPQSKPRFKVE